MTIFDEAEANDGEAQGPRLSVWMLDQMAEGLEDQAAGLSRRAIGLAEEETLLSKEIERHETEINRLLLRLDSVRSDRDSVVERIETLKHEASGIREQLCVYEEEAALASIEPPGLASGVAGSPQVYRAPVTRPLNAA